MWSMHYLKKTDHMFPQPYEPISRGRERVNWSHEQSLKEEAA